LSPGFARPPGAILDLTFTSGQHFSLDMGLDVETYPRLEPLAKPEAFEKAILGDAGWTVEWPELDIQIGADTLFLEALAQAAPDLTLAPLSRFVPRSSTACRRQAHCGSELVRRPPSVSNSHLFRTTCL